MESSQLSRARAYVAEHLPKASGSPLPAYHLTGGIGWINDPNGFSIYQGMYHLFFQYYPYDTVWGPMHWGHVRTGDFIHWERLPVALAPDTESDRDGCFSGSALELPDGRQMLLYTGVRKTPNGREFQTQCAAFGDGRDYEKYPGNPVLSGADLPEGASTRDFRDPKLWRAEGMYYAAVANRAADGSGAILLYESEDGLHWRYDGPLAENRNTYGRMWECPDFFPLDGTHVLLTSPQEMRAAPPEFHEGYGTLCLSGPYDRAAHRLCWTRAQPVDYGPDFYAPQTLETPDGRRVMIAWMQDWATAGIRRTDRTFQGQMTFPRELRFQDGRLVQNPVGELTACRGAQTSYRDVPLRGEVRLPGIHGRVLDLTAEFRTEQPGTPSGTFQISLAMDADHATALRCTPGAEGTALLEVDRTFSGGPPETACVRTFPVSWSDGKLRLRLLLDRYSLEIFVNDGLQAASFVLDTPETAGDIRFRAPGGLLLDVTQYALRL